MTVGDTRVAIRRMLRPPHPRERKVWWSIIGVAAGLVVVLQVARGEYAPALTLGAGIALGAAAVFTLLGRLLGWIALAIAFGIGLGFLPLFGVLGLELSLATAVFASVMGADVGAALARRLALIPPSGIKRATYPGRTLLRGALVAAGLAGGITSVVAVIAALRGIVVPTCDWRFGIGSFIAMPLASALLAGTIGHAMGALTGPRRVLGAVIAQLPAIVVAVAALWRFHASPPVYTYNAILGYFPGNMYDEDVQLSMALAWSRLEQLGWVIAVVALVAWRFDVASYRVRLRAPRPESRRGYALCVALAGAAVAVMLRLQGGALGFAVDAGDIEAALGGRIETEHFTIHYSQTPDIEADIKLIAADHEFRYNQVVSQLGAAPAGKIVSFYFADREQKARLHGSRDVEMAKPWRREIYLDHRAFPHPSLRHEIAHVIASEFGDWLWGVSASPFLGIPVFFSPGLVEGLAVAADWPAGFDRPNPHESARIIQKLGKEPSISSLLGLSFFSVGSAQGYTIAGSFLRFLLEKYGPAKLRDVYRNGGDFEAAYDVPRERLEQEWREMLSTIDVPDTVVKASAERFRKGSVFAKPCVHSIAKQRQRAKDAYADGDRATAVTLMRGICAEAPDEPGYRIDLADYLFGGDDDQRAEAHLLWSLVATDDRNVTVSLRAQAFRRLVQAAVGRAELDRARNLLAFARTLPLDLNERRQLDAEAFALAHAGLAGPSLRAYFFPPVDKKPDALNPLTAAQAAVAAEPELGFAHYLLGFQRYIRGDWPGAARELELAVGRELPGIAFVKNAGRLLAAASYRTRDHNRLAIATAVLSGSAMTSGDRMLAKDWQDRLQFDTRPRR